MSSYLSYSNLIKSFENSIVVKTAVSISLSSVILNVKELIYNQV